MILFRVLILQLSPPKYLHHALDLKGLFQEEQKKTILKVHYPWPLNRLVEWQHCYSYT